jgi:hypothetical protein
VLAAARALAAGGGPVTVAALESRLESDEDRRLLREVAVEGTTGGVTPLACVKALRRVLAEQRMAEIQRSLASADAEVHQALLEEKNQLGRLMAGL